MLSPNHLILDTISMKIHRSMADGASPARSPACLGCAVREVEKVPVAGVDGAFVHLGILVYSRMQVHHGILAGNPMAP